jgi:hypothetical protein
MLAENYRLWIYNGQDDGCIPYVGAQVKHKHTHTHTHTPFPLSLSFWKHDHCSITRTSVSLITGVDLAPRLPGDSRLAPLVLD